MTIGFKQFSAKNLQTNSLANSFWELATLRKTLDSPLVSRISDFCLNKAAFQLKAKGSFANKSTSTLGNPGSATIV